MAKGFFNYEIVSFIQEIQETIQDRVSESGDRSHKTISEGGAGGTHITYPSCDQMATQGSQGHRKSPVTSTLQLLQPHQKTGCDLTFAI